MAGEMRLKEVVTQDVVLPVQKINCNSRLNNETNSNDIPNSEDNYTNRYCRRWSNFGEIVSGRTESDDNNFHGSHNNNISVGDEDTDGNRQVLTCSSPVSSPEDDSYGDYEGQSSSSLDVSPQGDEYHCFSQEDITDSDFSDDGNRYRNGSHFNRGIVNPNYPGFQEFANDLEDSSDDEVGSNINNNNDIGKIELSESVNHLDSVENFQKAFYNKPKFDIGNCGDGKPENSESVKLENADGSLTQIKENVLCDSGVSSGVTTDNELESIDNGNNWFVQEDIVATAVFPVSGIYETTIITDDDSDSSPTEEAAVWRMTSEENRIADSRKNPDDLGSKVETKQESREKAVKETENGKKFEDTMRKEEKTQINVSTKNNFKANPEVTHRGVKEKPKTNSGNRRSTPLAKEKGSNLDLGFFDVYNIETAMPNIDIEAIESHLKAAKEEERRRRTDREEIRRRLAMGTDNDEYYGGERTFRKPSLQTRLQSGMNLQICFMNEAMSDNESPSSDCELGNNMNNIDKNKDDKLTSKRPDTLPVNNSNFGSIPPNHVRPSTSLLTLPLKKENEFKSTALSATDFFSCQAQLQAEARLALSQAKEMARMQMEVEKQNLRTSPITEMVRSSLEKVGIQFPHDRRRLSRQILTEMNIAQLQVIVNDLHTQIEKLNETLVKFLIGRDDLHMEQDSMLVDIEDLTRYLGAKERPEDVPNLNIVHKNNNINRTQNQKKLTVNEVRSMD